MQTVILETGLLSQTPELKDNLKVCAEFESVGTVTHYGCVKDSSPVPSKAGSQSFKLGRSSVRLLQLFTVTHIIQTLRFYLLAFINLG